VEGDFFINEIRESKDTKILEFYVL